MGIGVEAEITDGDLTFVGDVGDDSAMSST
jgi:hypothetical protein